MKISARNQLAGTVSRVKEGIVTAEVVIKIGSGSVNSDRSTQVAPQPDQGGGNSVLSIEGLVVEPRQLTPADLATLPRANFTEALRDHAPGAPSTQRWSGPRLIDVLNWVGLLPVAQYLRVGGGDYVVPISLPQAEAALLADTLDDQPLTVAQGAPWRFTLPSPRRFINVKGVDRLVLTAEPGENTALVIRRARNRARRALKKPQT